MRRASIEHPELSGEPYGRVHCNRFHLHRLCRFRRDDFRPWQNLGMPMSLDLSLGAALAACLLVFFLIALLRPEKF
jgi:K+-transporting ATPase KdpF subunit